MENLEVIELYENSNHEKTKTFINTAESTLKVQTEKKYITRDIEWIHMMEEVMPHIDSIFRSPNRFIKNEEETVKIEQAKKVSVETIKHLSKHTNLIQEVNEDDEIKPSKILNINKEETFDTYENRFIYTLIINMEAFVAAKKRKLVDGSYLKDDKSVQYKAASVVGQEHISIDLSIKTSLHTKKDDGRKNGESLAARIDRIEQQIIDLKNSEVFKALHRAHVALVRPPIKKTNVILKNTNFQYALILWNYLQEHFGDDNRRDKKDKNYEEEGALRGFFDDTFLLNYLALCTLNKDEYSTKNVKEKVMKQVIQKIIDLNASLTEEELKDMVGEQFTLVKYRNTATMDGIGKIYRKHIDKYFNKINNVKLN